MRRGRAFTLSAVLALAACAQRHHDWPKPSPALWEVSGPGGQHAWLFGTVHSLPSDMTWRTDKLEDALARSSVLVVEIADLANAADATSAFNRLSTTPGLPPLSQRVPPADRPALAALLKQADIGDRAFPHTETWGAAMIVANRLNDEDPASGVDRALIAGARRVVGLETFEQQYGIFDRLPQAQQATMLMAVAEDAAHEVEDRQAVEWLTGNIAALERDSQGGVLADAGLRQALQIDRNLAWDRRIEQMLADGEKPFVAVGAAHMFGHQGLPALLAAHGYKVRRIE